MNKKAITALFIISLLIGIADFVTTSYGLSIGLIEADGLYIPFLSTVVLFGCGLFANYLYDNLTCDNKGKEFFKVFSICSLFILSFSMIIPIMINVSLIK
jgi:hypothetical protein